MEKMSRNPARDRRGALGLGLLLACLAAGQAAEGSLPAGPMRTLRGESIEIGQFRDRFVLVLFSNEDSKEEAKDLLRTHTAEFLPLVDLVVLSVIDPGPSAKLASRGAISGRIRKEIDRENARIRAGLPEASRAPFDARTRHDVIDWDGSLTRTAGAPAGRVGQLLIGPDGAVAREVCTADAVSLRASIRVVEMGPAAYLKGLGRGERIERLIEQIEAR